MTLTNILAKVAAVTVAASLVVGVAFVAAPRAEALTEAQIQSIISLLQSFGADSSTIANVDASLRGNAPSTPSTPSTPSACNFTRDLTIGATGADVTALQQALIAAGYSIPAGATGYFGTQTQAAVAAWQTAAGVTPPAGYFGPKSRAAFPCSSGPSTGPTTPAGTGLTVSAGASVSNALAPQGASRVPFTNFNVTAGNDGDVVINSVTVQRVGPAQDAAFQGVVLVDLATGQQIGVAKTFNSNHQANIGAPITVPRGTTKTFQVAGNMASSLASYAGEAPGISVVGINTSATVSGALPITGAFHTTNATLTVGSLSLDVSNAFAANTTGTKEIGTTANRVSGFRLTAGSAEDVRLKTLTFNQTGSVSSTDLANVMVNVGGTAYPTTVSSDGKYYTATLGSGLVIPKGNQVEVYVTYDIIGSNASNRTIIFDVDKTTDIYGTGEVYGYGISPNTTGASSVPTSRGNTTETTGTPYVYANQVTVSGASVTTISKANEVPAQNIAINVPNQPLGGIVVDLKGEAMTVQSQVFHFNYSTGAASSNLLTNVTLVDQNGAVVAGPVDGVAVNGTEQKVTFTDTVTYKTGRGVYTIRGKIPSTHTGGVTITASTTPSSDWSTIRGETTGNTISLSTFSTAVTMNPMTIKAGALVIGPASTPASQTITAGGTAILMANFAFDATQSGEDARFSSVPARLTFATGLSTNLSACQLFDGSTALNTGSNVVNPSGTSPSDNTFTLDNPVTVTKGSVKTLGLRCNVAGSTANNATFSWAPGAAAFDTSFTVTGATSGTSIDPTASSGTAPTFTIGSGAVTVSSDASNPAYKIAAGGSTGVTNNVMKFRASNEDVHLTKVGLTLSSTASSSATDLVQVTLWDGATQVGTATFLPGSTVATSTLSQTLLLQKNVDKALTVKANFSNIGTGEAATSSGRFVTIDFLNGEGTGVESGSTLYPSGTATSNGTRVFKSIPTVALDTLPTTGLADGRLMRFSVTADAAGPVGITQFAINVATSTASLTNVTIYGFENSGYSTPISGVSNDGNLQATNDCASGCASNSPNLVIGVTTSGGTATAVQVPAGQTRYFEVRASVSGSATGASVTTKLLGSSSFPSTAAVVQNNLLLATGATGVSSSDNVFVWSPNSTTTSVRLDQDWTNGFGVSGLPAGGLLNTRSH